MTSQDRAIVVSRQSFESTDPPDIVGSNVSFVNALREEYVDEAEISEEALLSYYVDWYLAEVNNGGFSQFVYNTRWRAGVADRVRRGLRAIGATDHAALFEQSARVVDGFGAARLDEYFEGEYFGENRDRDILDRHDDRFHALDRRESIMALNAAWIRSRPNLRVLALPEMEAEVRRRAAAVPNRADRVARALAAEEPYQRSIRTLCAAAGHELDFITAGDPTHVYKGRTVLAWYFRTNRGLFYMVESDGRALMFDAETNARIAEVPAAR